MASLYINRAEVPGQPQESYQKVYYETVTEGKFFDVIYENCILYQKID
jgi:hypothetical protein